MSSTQGSRHRRVDALVNNAGVFVAEPFDSHVLSALASRDQKPN